VIRNTEFSNLSAAQKALVMSPDPEDRVEAAKAGYGMEVLIDDPSEYIRYRVAWNDYGWDVLKDDPCISIQELLEARFGADRSGLEQWAKEHPEQLHKPNGAKTHEHFKIGSVRFESTPEKVIAERPRKLRFQDVSSLSAFYQKKVQERNRELRDDRTLTQSSPVRSAR
jgi:hypothetical protein